MKRILRIPEVIQTTGLCKSAIYFMQQQGTFPHSVKIAGSRRSGWWEHEIQNWLDTTPHKQQQTTANTAA